MKPWILALALFLNIGALAHNDDHADEPPALSDEDTERIDGHGETRRTTDGDFCKDPNGTICSRSLPRSKFEAERRPVESAILDNTLRFFSSRIPGITRERIVSDLSSLKDTNFDRWMGLFRQMTQESESELERQLGSDFNLKSQFEGEIKTAQAAAIDAHTSIPAAARQRMKAEVARAKFVMPSEYIRSLQSMPTATARQFMKFYQTTCGQLGLSDNAFSFGGGDARGGPGIVICPGTWIAGMALKAHNGTSVKDYIIFTLGHELGHKVDAGGQFSSVYQKMLNCLQRTSAGRGFKPSTIKDPRGGSARIPNNKELSDYMDEISADYWAAETLARLRPSASSEQMQALAKNTLSDMCPSVGNESHPPGKFRVSFMARNPRLLKRAGCPSPSSSDPACAVEGAVGGGPGSGGGGGGTTPTPPTASPDPKPPKPGTSSFADRAEELLNTTSAQQAFQFLRTIRDPENRRVFSAMFQARYTVDPANLRRAFFGANTDPVTRDAARREIQNRFGRTAVQLISSTFGQRPEHAMIFEDRLRRAVTRGDENTAASISASLFGTLSRGQTEKALEKLQLGLENARSAQDRNLVAHLLAGAKEALGKPPSNNRAENFFRGQFARQLGTVKEGERKFKETLDRAVGGDTAAHDELVQKLNPESVVDVMRNQLDGGDEAVAVKIAKVFGRKDADGVYHLDLGSRSVDFGHGEETPHEILRLGTSDDDIKVALRAYPDLHRFAIDPKAREAKNRVWVRPDGKGGVEAFTPTAAKPSPSPEPIRRPATISNTEAVKLMATYCGSCHGPGGKNTRYLDDKGEIDLTKTTIAAMVKNVRRDTGANPMPPIGSLQSLALYPKERDALVQWLQTKESK